MPGGSTQVVDVFQVSSVVAALIAATSLWVARLLRKQLSDETLSAKENPAPALWATVLWSRKVPAASLSNIPWACHVVAWWVDAARDDAVLDNRTHCAVELDRRLLEAAKQAARDHDVRALDLKDLVELGAADKGNAIHGDVRRVGVQLEELRVVVGGEVHHAADSLADGDGSLVVDSRLAGRGEVVQQQVIRPVAGSCVRQRRGQLALIGDQGTFRGRVIGERAAEVLDAVHHPVAVRVGLAVGPAAGEGAVAVVPRARAAAVGADRRAADHLQLLAAVAVAVDVAPLVHQTVAIVV